MTVTALESCLTSAEAEAVANYLEATEGVLDTFDQLDAATLHNEQAARSNADTFTAQLFQTLTDWHNALDRLHSELALTTRTQMMLTPAAEDYVRTEAVQFMHCLNLARKAFCDWHFADQAGPRFHIDGTSIVFSGFPPVPLTAEIAAEAAP
ncbi:hypothetical protein OG252_33170 [Streptomyces sp. NBC_01352]|uniref:hypothetical protein n=1 Tax=Streptomyces sp. NBC_01352 TaxID=2903834 RepID=UPI002E379940|nr:hypothetical protein [Streptomyces sp. NBC_01352]